MPLKDNAGGALANKAAVVAKATVANAETLYKFNENVYETYTLPGEKTPNTHKRLKFAAGQVYPDSQVTRASA